MAEFSSGTEKAQLLAWSYSPEAEQLSFPLPQTAWVDLCIWKRNFTLCVHKMYLEEAPFLKSTQSKILWHKSSVITFHPMHCLLFTMSSPAAFCTRMMPLSLWLPPALHESPSWESFDTQDTLPPSHVSGMPISFSSDKTGWRALAQRTNLRVALDNPLNWWQINLKRNRKWKERSHKAQIWADDICC